MTEENIILGDERDNPPCPLCDRRDCPGNCHGPTKHPIQPLAPDHEGTVRFKGNALVRYLLDEGPFDLNDLARLPDIPAEDYEQLAMLIGYSLSGFGDLSYVRDETYEAATHMADKELPELQARLVHLEGLVAMLRDKLRHPMATLFSVHPDDLKG